MGGTFPPRRNGDASLPFSPSGPGRYDQMIANGSKIIGILDPPRAGVHKDVITALRRCRGLDNIIYVACNPSSVQDNLLQLTLPVNNKRKAP